MHAVKLHIRIGNLFFTEVLKIKINGLATDITICILSVISIRDRIMKFGG